MLIPILASTLLSSGIALFLARFLTVFGQKRTKLIIPLTALSSGVLLSTALLHLAPETIHEGLDVEQGFLAIFLGIVLFFLLERLVIWYHHHDHDHQHNQPQVKPGAYLIALGDTVHNFIDGVAIAASFLVSFELGIFTVAAVFLHEIPQEVADFNIMISRGLSIKKATIVNLISAATAIVGALITYVVRVDLEPYLPWMIGLSAGMFLYIALSDLIPELHHHAETEKHRWTQLVWLAAGVLLIVGLGFIGHE